MEQVKKPWWRNPEFLFNFACESAWKLITLYFMLKG